MDQIIVNLNGGGTLRLYSYKNNSGVTRAEQLCELLGQDVVNISLVSAVHITFAIGDYIDVFGFIYKLNTLPNERKLNDRNFEYDMRFEGPQYDLIKAQYLDIDTTGFSTGTSFALIGDLEDFAKLIIRNAERVFGTGSWLLGDFPTNTATLNLTFDGETCQQVLLKLCEAYDQHFDIERLPGDIYKLNIRKQTTVVADSFRYGRAKGIYNLTRQTVSNKNIVTRLFAYGSTRNIGPTYRNGSPRLKMPINFILSEGKPAIENIFGITDYGVIEGSVIFEDIYPHRTGTVTALSSDRLQFYDFNMTFDLMEKDSNNNTVYLIPGTEAKIRFNTGDLAGYEFSLDLQNGYNASQQLFTMLPYTDQRGLEFPSDGPAFRVQVGDEYVILDIKLPQSYIDAAENELLARAKQYLIDNSKPWVQYSLTTEADYIKAKFPANIIGNYFKIGQYVPVKDADMSLNENMLISGFTRNLIVHYQYEVTLGESRAAQRRRSLKNVVTGINATVATTVGAPTLSNITNIVNNQVNNFSSSFKKTTDTYQTQIDELKAAFQAIGPFRKSYTVLSDTNYFYHPDFDKMTVLVVERNNSTVEFTQDTNSYGLHLPENVFKDETLHITFRKNF